MQGFFLTAITELGPEVVLTSPEKVLGELEEKEISLKSMPMSGKDGDFISTYIENFHIAALLCSVPPIHESYDKRDTFTSIGVFLDKDENPIPYRYIFETIVNECKKHKLLTLDTLKHILPQLYQFSRKNQISLYINTEKTITLTLTKEKTEKTGIDLLNDALW